MKDLSELAAYQLTHLAINLIRMTSQITTNYFSTLPSWSLTGLYLFFFFWPPASRAGKVEKLPARIETYQPEKKYERGTFFVVVHMTAFWAGSLRSREYGKSA